MAVKQLAPELMYTLNIYSRAAVDSLDRNNQEQIKKVCVVLL